jgi:Ca2+-binding RTX toxin-like protein
MNFSSIITNVAFDFAFTTEGSDSLTYTDVPTAQTDILLNSAGVDAIVLLGGDDTAVDDNGSRIYFGNTGNDFIQGNQGAETLVGGRDSDILEGNFGDDVLFGNLDNDTLRGGDGNDVIFGGQQDDLLVGLTGEDRLFGDLGNDRILSGDGNDTLTGGNGGDIFAIDVPGSGIDIITDFATSELNIALEGIDDMIRLPTGLTFGSILIQDSGNSQTLIVLASTGQTLAILQNILPTAISSANFITA